VSLSGITKALQTIKNENFVGDNITYPIIDHTSIWFENKKFNVISESFVINANRIAEKTLLFINCLGSATQITSNRTETQNIHNSQHCFKRGSYLK
jgi:hypothetical protein